MPGCAVPGCKTGFVPGKVAFQTFSFPTSNKLKQLWTEQVNRKNWQPNKYSRICAKHFGKEAFFEKKNKAVIFSEAHSSRTTAAQVTIH